MSHLAPDLIVLFFVVVLSAVPVGLCWIVWAGIRRLKKTIDSRKKP